MKSIELVEKKYIHIPDTKVVVDMSVRGLCCKPYINHPLGCPNFGRKKGCPPNINSFLDNYEKTAELVAIGFYLSEWIDIRRQEQPDWTDKALGNLRHWQPHVRSHLNELLLKVNTNGYDPVFAPEAMGVNVTETCKNVGTNLEWPPKNWVYQVALLGRRVT
jgi:hypothetical protein